MPPVTAASLTSLCLHYLLLLRTIAIGGQLVAMSIAHAMLDLRMPVVPIALTILALGFFTFLSWRRLRAGGEVADRTFVVQLLVDVAALAALIYLTGGSSNPFVLLFLLPVTVAAATLRPAYTWIVVAAAAACYTLLMFVYVPFSHWSHPASGFSLHLWGMWLGFLLSAGLVAYFVARMGSALRARDQELARAREHALEARQTLALGTLAAGAAHELGTPLATMAVLAKELELGHAHDRALGEQLRLLRTQVDRCKAILARMASDAGQTQADAGRRVRLDRYLSELVEEWRSLRPGADVAPSWSGTEPAPEIVADRTLTQAIMTVLNNAADASAEPVELEAGWSPTALRIAVRDKGPGLPEALRGRLGRVFLSTKPDGEGMGLGLYLARTTLERLGGRLRLDARPDCPGVVAEIELPLATLLVGT